jgi:hypothetical protein
MEEAMKIAIFWVTTRVVWQMFSEVSEKHAASFTVGYPEEEGRTFMRIIGKYLPDDTASRSRRQSSSFSLPFSNQDVGELNHCCVQVGINLMASSHLTASHYCHNHHHGHHDQPERANTVPNGLSSNTSV